MHIVFLIVFAALLTPNQLFAAETLTPKQSKIISDCSAPIGEAYVAKKITLDEYQFESFACYKKAGADFLIPAAWRSATSSAAIGTLNEQATAATNALWNNDTLRINFSELTEKLQNTPISPEAAQKIGECIQSAIPPDAASRAPNAETQRAIAACFKSTPYESLLTPLYTKISTVIDCGTDELGVGRVADVARVIQTPTEKEIAVIKKCYVERTAPAISAIALINIVATSGVRDAGLLLYMTLSSMWLALRGKKSHFGVVQNALNNLPVDLAIIRLQLGATKQTIRTAVSDSFGRFYIFAPRGSYELHTTKPGFIFPSQFKNSPTTLEISDAAPVVQKTIHVDPVLQEPVAAPSTLRRAGAHASAAIAIGSPALGIISALIVHKWWIIALGIFNLAAYAGFRYFMKRKELPAYGTITNSNNKPCANVIVRVFETQYNKLIGSVVTDARGRYGILAGAGTYIVHVGGQEKTITLTAARGVIAENFIL